MDLVKAYEDARARVSELVREAGVRATETRVPACPDWSVKDLLAHLVGIAGDYSEGHQPDISAEAAADRDPEAHKKVDDWTNLHISSRRTASVDDLVAEWELHAAKLRPMLSGEREWPEGMPFWAGFGLIADLATHEHDIRAALGEPGARDSEAMDIAFQTFSTALQMRIKGEGAEPLKIVADGTEQILGDGEPVATLEGDRFDVIRALSGRRTQQQVRALFADGDPEPYLPIVSLYPPPEEPVE